MAYPNDIIVCDDMVLVNSIDYSELDVKFTALGDIVCKCAADNAVVVNTKLATIETNITTTINSRIDTLDSGFRQVLSNLGDEINVNEVKIDNHNNTMIMTI